MMKFNHLIPELTVSDYKKSLFFYTEILGFKVEYDRPEKDFSYLSFQGSQLMICGGNDTEESPWYTGKLEHPYGRGMHLQMDIDSLEPLLKSLAKHQYAVKEPAKDYWFRKGKFMIGVRGVLVMDPDGYLLMFNEDLGKKPVEVRKDK